METKEDSSPIVELSMAIEMLGEAMGKLTAALKVCRESGYSQIDIRDAILERLPEEDRPAFMAQWPMISMVLMSIK